MPQVFQPPVVLGIKLVLLAILAVIAAAWLTLYKALPAHSGLHPHAEYPGRPLASTPCLQHAGSDADPGAVALRDAGRSVIVRRAPGRARTPELVRLCLLIGQRGSKRHRRVR